MRHRQLGDVGEERVGVGEPWDLTGPVSPPPVCVGTRALQGWGEAGPLGGALVERSGAQGVTEWEA